MFFFLILSICIIGDTIFYFKIEKIRMYKNTSFPVFKGHKYGTWCLNLGRNID
jgi:hypothetical protein